MSSSVDRLQIKLKGRRFEFVKEAALEHLLFFKEYLQKASEQEQKELQKLHNFTYEKSEQKLVGAAGTAPVISHLDVFTFTGGDAGIPTATPDYFGIMQVALRKNRMPAFVWDEMNRKEQEAVTWSVNLFKIEKFMKCFGTVTAKGADPNAKDDHEDENRKGGEEPNFVGDTMAHELAQTHMKIVEAKEQQKEKVKQQQQQQEATTGKRGKVVQDEDDDDENVVLTRVGCFLCGVATHDIKDCPHNQKQAKEEEK